MVDTENFEGKIYTEGTEITTENGVVHTLSWNVYLKPGYYYLGKKVISVNEKNKQNKPKEPVIQTPYKSYKIKTPPGWKDCSYYGGPNEDNPYSFINNHG